MLLIYVFPIVSFYGLSARKIRADLV
jgi:hypothetical protein